MDEDSVDEATGAAEGGVPAGDDLLALAREALIAANPDAVPEMIGGATAAELRASLAAAKAVGARIAGQVRTQLAAERVPAGGSTRTVAVEASSLSPSAKIAAGIQQQGRR